MASKNPDIYEQMMAAFYEAVWQGTIKNVKLKHSQIANSELQHLTGV